MPSFTFTVEKTCPICGKSTRIVRTRARIIIEKTDEDFCVHYKDFNPYLYRIWVCECCGYAADEKSFCSSMPERSQKRIQKFLKGKKIAFPFMEIREIPDAIASFRLAIFFLDLIEASLSRQAGLYLGLAWIYRFTEDEAMEYEMMKKAAELYDLSLMTEHYPIGGMTDFMVIYLLGAIYFRIKDYDKCMRYLSRLINNKEFRTMDPHLHDKAKRLWIDVRTIKKALLESSNAAANTPADVSTGKEMIF